MPTRSTTANVSWPLRRGEQPTAWPCPGLDSPAMRNSASRSMGRYSASTWTAARSRSCCSKSTRRCCGPAYQVSRLPRQDDRSVMPVSRRPDEGDNIRRALAWPSANVWHDLPCRRIGDQPATGQGVTTSGGRSSDPALPRTGRQGRSARRSRRPLRADSQ